MAKFRLRIEYFFEGNDDLDAKVTALDFLRAHILELPKEDVNVYVHNLELRPGGHHVVQGPWRKHQKVEATHE